jgi:flagellar protein FlaG
MGIRFEQAGYPGLDPAAENTSRVDTDRRIGSSPPATSQTASSTPQMPEQGAAAVPQMDAAEVESTLEGINEYLSEIESSLSFVYDEASGRSAVQVLDENGEIIRQIPPQELLDVYARIRDVVGILLDESG